MMRTLLSAIMLVLGLVPVVAEAQTNVITWDNGAGNAQTALIWDTGDNWSGTPDNTAPGINDEAVLPALWSTGTAAFKMNAGQSVYKITNSGTRPIALTANGTGPLTLTLGGGGLSSKSSFDIGSSTAANAISLDFGNQNQVLELNGTQTWFRNVYYGSGTLTKKGTGELLLYGLATNAFTGSWVLEAGKVTLRSANNTTPNQQLLGGRPVEIRNGAELQVNDIRYVSSDTLSGSGLLRLRGHTSLDRFLDLQGNCSSFTGSVIIEAGGLVGKEADLRVNNILGTTNITMQGASKLSGSGTLVYHVADDVTKSIMGGTVATDKAIIDITGLSLQIDRTGTQTLTSYTVADYTYGTLVGAQFANHAALTAAGYSINYAGGTGKQIVLTLPSQSSLSKLTASPVSGTTISLGSDLAPQSPVTLTSVTLSNTGDAGTQLAVSAAELSGANASLFSVVGFAAGLIEAGASQSYDIRFAGSTPGNYTATVTFLTNAADGVATATYTLTAKVLQPGDATGDFAVDFADYLILESKFGTAGGATVADADFNKDGAVDFADYLILESNFGAVAAVPEPGTLSLLGLAALGLIRRRK